MGRIGLAFAIAAALLLSACQGSRIVPLPAQVAPTLASADDPLALPGSLAQRLGGGLGRGERGAAGPLLLDADGAIGRVLDAQARRPGTDAGMCPKVTVRRDTCVTGPRSPNALWLEQYWRKTPQQPSK